MEYLTGNNISKNKELANKYLTMLSTYTLDNEASEKEKSYVQFMNKNALKILDNMDKLEVLYDPDDPDELNNKQKYNSSNVEILPFEPSSVNTRLKHPDFVFEKQMSRK